MDWDRIQKEIHYHAAAFATGGGSASSSASLPSLNADFQQLLDKENSINQSSSSLHYDRTRMNSNLSSNQHANRPPDPPGIVISDDFDFKNDIYVACNLCH